MAVGYRGHKCFSIKICSLLSSPKPAQIRNLELIHLPSHNDLNLLSFSFRWASSFRHIQSGEPHGPTWGHRLFALCHQEPRKQIGKLDTHISLQQLPKLFTSRHHLGILLSDQVRQGQVKEEIYFLLFYFFGWPSHGFRDTRILWDIFVNSMLQIF